MDRHWNNIIEPLCTTMLPKNIVVIGKDSQNITQKLLSYCGTHTIKLHIVNPQLDSLSAIPSIDMIFIDGEDQWKAISHQLHLLQEQSELIEHFPLVVIHNAHSHIAYFICNSILELSYRDIAGCKGIGLLMTNHHTNTILSSLETKPLLPLVEDRRGEWHTKCELHNLQKTHAFIQESFLHLRNQYAQQSNDYIISCSKYDECQKEIHTTQQLLHELQLGYQELHRAINELSAENTKLQTVMSEMHSENTTLENVINDLHTKNAGLQSIINHLIQTASWRLTHPLRLFGSLLKKLRTK